MPKRPRGPALEWEELLTFASFKKEGCSGEEASERVNAIFGRNRNRKTFEERRRRDARFRRLLEEADFELCCRVEHFLEILATRCPRVGEAMAEAGLGRGYVRRRRLQDPEFDESVRRAADRFRMAWWGKMMEAADQGDGRARTWVADQCFGRARVQE